MSAQRRFYKMSGSGNDFVFFDLRDGAAPDLETPKAIQRITARGTGVGADGVVFIGPDSEQSFGIRYYNSDGSLGELCGNASLCSLRLAAEIGLSAPGEVTIATDAGVLTGRLVDGKAEIDLEPVVEVQRELAGIARLERESAMGFARAGVPHVVVLDRDVSSADVTGRGSAIRRDRSLRDGANVNFVSPGQEDRWLVRTYERGVEGETLACGTGAVACGILLTEWGRASSPVCLRTRSGRDLEVRIRKDSGRWLCSLRGGADLVYDGRLRDLAVSPTG